MIVGMTVDLYQTLEINEISTRNILLHERKVQQEININVVLWWCTKVLKREKKLFSNEEI